jgi:predicted O-methyltransferase YrrM
METEVDRNIRAWAMSEVMPWRMRMLADEAVPHAALQLNARSKTAFIYVVRDGNVSVEAKRSELALAHAERRSQMYLGFFQEVLRDYPSIPDTTFILDVDDMPPPRPTVPILQFQKPAGSFSILVPDIDFIGWNHYPQPAIVDAITYDSKAVSAIFVGGTSGQTNTVETVLNPVAQRLRAAKYFRGHSDVHFYLTTLSRCANVEAEQALRDLGFGGPPIQWSEQFAHKFIISVDGNGATCSRVVIALKSNSVLLKYDSPHHLYYFRGLLPWRHYVPIRVDSDIEKIIRMERKGLCAFASIAEEGRSFAETYLTRRRVLQYAAQVLTNYALYVYPAKDRQHMTATKQASEISSLPKFSHRSLNEIGLAVGTDKSSQHHDYLGFYELALRGQSKIDRLLEIGVYHGASVRMWCEFLPNAQIVGLDVNQTATAHADERIAIEIGDQADPATLRRLVAVHGPFDVIVDDGSHIWTHQIVSFETLFPLLAPGGLYILEDVHTSYGALAEAHGRGCPISTAAYLHRLSDLLYGWGIERTEDDLTERLRPLADLIESFTTIRRSVLIRRRPSSSR